MLTSLGAGDLIGRKYHGLSQGEKQICLIARSLMEEPDIIILDEATAAVDAENEAPHTGGDRRPVSRQDCRDHSSPPERRSWSGADRRDE